MFNIDSHEAMLMFLVFFRELPYNVTQEEALKYPEVKTKLEIALKQLKTIVTMFLDKITNSTDLLPFCITYMARVLHRALTSKFPHTPEKDILKVIKCIICLQSSCCELFCRITVNYSKIFILGHWKPGVLSIPECSYSGS